MPTQYEKLRETLLRHSHKKQEVRTRQIRAWFALDWGNEQTIFPAHFACEPEGKGQHRQPLVLQAQAQPLLERCYGVDGQLLRSTYTVLAESTVSTDLPQHAYDLLYQILIPYQGKTLSLQILKKYVSAYLDAHGLERPGLLDNIHRYTSEGGYPICLNGRHLLTPAGQRGQYIVTLPEAETARTDLVVQLEPVYQHEGQGLFEPELFESLIKAHRPNLWESHTLELNVLHKLCSIQFGLPELIKNGLLNHTAQEQVLIKLIREVLPLHTEHLRRGLQQLHLLLEERETQDEKSLEQILEHFLNPLHPDLEQSWASLDTVYFSLQREKADIERFFHEDVPVGFRQMAPKELFEKALKWFLGGVKGKGSRHLTQAMHQRLTALRQWECPGPAFWESITDPPFALAPAQDWLVPWAEIHLQKLLQVPGLDVHSDETYPAVYVACGILAVLFPEYVFALSPPSLEGLKYLSRRDVGALYLGALHSDPQASDTLAWMAGILGQVYQIIQGLRLLRPQAAAWINPRRLDMLLYLVRNEARRQASFLHLLKEVSQDEAI